MSMGMERPQALQVKTGDVVTGDSWNKCTRDRRQRIAQPAKVLAVKQGARSQTGVMLTLATESGDTVHLDAAWFEAVQWSEVVTPSDA